MTDDSSSGHSPPSVADDSVHSWGDGGSAREASRDRPSYGVITQLAAVTACSPLELSPLHETIEVDALDELFVTPSATDTSTVTVTFTHADHRITVGSDGTITVSPSSEAPDGAIDDWDHVSTVRPTAGDDLPSRVVVAIAEATDHEPASVRSTLADRCDIESLSRLNQPRANGVPRTGATVRFSMLGYDVVVAPDGSVALGSTLSRLKQTGGNVLIVGDVPDAIVDSISTTLLGGPDRRTVFALLDREVSVVSDRLSSMPASSARVLNHATATRSRAAARTRTTKSQPEIANEHENETEDGNENGTPPPQLDSKRANGTCPAEPTPIPTVTDVAGTFEEFANTIDTALTDVWAAGGLEPGDVRLCVESLRPLFEERDADGAVAFLTRTCEAVKRTASLAHYVLALPHESGSVRTIEPVFDATIELRVNGTVAQQRWHIHDSAYVTEWFPLPRRRERGDEW